MTLLSSARCDDHGVCRDESGEFSDPLLQGIDCTDNRINAISGLYDPTDGKGTGDLCLGSTNYYDMIRCRATEVREGKWNTDKELLGWLGRLFLFSVPGAWKASPGKRSYFMDSGIKFKSVSLMDGNALKEAKEKLKNFHSFLVTSDTAVRVSQQNLREFLRIRHPSNYRNYRHYPDGGPEWFEEEWWEVRWALDASRTISDDYMVPGDRLALRDRIIADNSRYRIKPKLPAGTIIADILKALEPQYNKLVSSIDEEIIDKLDQCLKSEYFRGLVADAGGPRRWEPSTEFYNPNGVFTLKAVFGLLEDLSPSKCQVDPVPTVLKILSELDLETRIHQDLTDCREMCNLEENIIKFDSYHLPRGGRVREAEVLLNTIKGMIERI